MCIFYEHANKGNSEVKKAMNELKKRYLSAKRALFDKVFAEKLNTEQRRAAFTANGPLLVLAGAGSGKTTVLVNRIVYLIKYGNAYFAEQTPEDLSLGLVCALENALDMPTSEISELLPEFASSPCPPWSVLAITFTNKAAGEIRERLCAAFSDPAVSESIWAGTFHSVCLRILRKYADRLGYASGFSIYDTDDKKRLISICMKELSIDEKRLNPRAVANEISRAKDNLVSEDNFELALDPRENDIKKIYRLYQRKLKEYNALDFDDIIMQTVTLLENHADAREYYQNKFRYILVDEYQDTNYAQFVLTKLLAEKRRNIMVVGDDDQSIYRFRGATIENILNFDKNYPDATVVKLEQNYRSTENILSAANAIIKNNGDRHEKSLWCDKGKGEKIILHESYDHNEEGKYIISEITKEVKDKGKKYSDFAVLYRVNELARYLETAFAKSAIPYKILGGMRFYDRKEIKDMVAYLSLINSDSDSLRLKRIINEPKRKIGAATVDAVEQLSEATGQSMYSVMKDASQYTLLGKAADKLLSFVSMIEKFRASNLSPSALIEAVFTDTGYKAMLESEGFEGEGKIQNVEEFISAAVEYEKRTADANEEATLLGFLEEISLVSDLDKYDENADAVVLMTIHAAKGLEFPTVFLSGAEDGIFPSQQNMGEEEEMSEERRLMYVAITRAKDKLYITHARNRTMYGKTCSNPLSVFIREELPESLTFCDSGRRLQSKLHSLANKSSQNSIENNYFREVNRPLDIFPAKKVGGAAGYGIEKFAPGTRVSHAMFGEGKILSARDLGGDVLYEVAFDSGQSKKLMATFAKLKKI